MPAAAVVRPVHQQRVPPGALDARQQVAAAPRLVDVRHDDLADLPARVELHQRDHRIELGRAHLGSKHIVPLRLEQPTIDGVRREVLELLARSLEVAGGLLCRDRNEEQDRKHDEALDHDTAQDGGGREDGRARS